VSSSRKTLSPFPISTSSRADIPVWGRLLALHDLGRTQEFEDEFAQFREGNANNPAIEAAIALITSKS
jgi:hypothetical protein